jgi:hypothetical protein
MYVHEGSFWHKPPGGLYGCTFPGLSVAGSPP